MRNYFSNRVLKIALYLAIPISVYFINVEIQSYLGRNAVQATGLTSLSLDLALTKAKTENKLIIVDVSAIWCSTCRRLDNQVFADETVRKAIKERFIFSRIEYESAEGTAFLEKYESTGFPNLWLLDHEGKVVKKLNVVFDPGEFLRQLPTS